MTRGIICDRCRGVFVEDDVGIKLDFLLQMNGELPHRDYCQSCTVQLYKILHEFEKVKPDLHEYDK